MPKREVEESDFLASQELVKLTSDLLNNKESRELFLKAKKIARPNEPVPELDAAAPLRGELDELKAQIAAEKKAREEAASAAETSKKTAEFQAQWDRQKQVLRDSGWYADGVEKVVKLAEERGIPDLEAAAALYEKMNPSPAPTQPGGRGSWSFLDGPPDDGSDMKKLLETKGENEGLLNKMIGDTLTDLRGTGQRR